MVEGHCPLKTELSPAWFAQQLSRSPLAADDKMCMPTWRSASELPQRPEQASLKKYFL